MIESLSKLVERVRDKKVREILSVTQKTRKYPIDALTDGSFGILVKYIVELEDQVAATEMGTGDTRP
jgi:hypothetical protein